MGMFTRWCVSSFSSIFFCIKVNAVYSFVFYFLSLRFPRLFQHVREEEEAAGDLGSVQLRAPRAHGLRPARAEVHGLAAAMAEPAVGHGQPAQAHGGPLLHHPHPAGSHEGKSESRRRHPAGFRLITILLCARSPTSPSLSLSFSPKRKKSPCLIFFSQERSLSPSVVYKHVKAHLLPSRLQSYTCVLYPTIVLHTIYMYHILYYIPYHYTALHLLDHCFLLILLSLRPFQTVSVY